MTLSVCDAMEEAGGFKYFKTIMTFKEKMKSLPIFLNTMKATDKRRPQTLCLSSH